MRRRFETEEMLEHENKARDWLSRKIKKPIHKINDGLWGVDWAVYETNGNLYGFIEYKKRKHKRGQFPDVRMSGMKYLRLKQYKETFKVKCSICVEFEDAITLAPIEAIDPKLVSFGRTSNFRDSYEVEPCIVIPTEKLTIVE